MSLWHRLGNVGVYGLIRQCNGCYSIPGAIGSLSGSAILMMRHFRVLEKPCGSCNTIFSTVPARRFAAPAQFISKPKLEEKSGVRINEAITELEVRLVTDQGHRVVSIKEALYLARKLDLDLVEVQRKVKVEGAGPNMFNPAVCKLMDYCKEKYKQDVKLKERVKDKAAIALRSTEVKEVRFKAKTELKDLKVKAESVKRLMERGYRVKCTAMPTGKEDEDLGGLLLNILSLIDDISTVETGPHLDTRHAYVIVRHIKFASKKGKKSSKAVDTVSSALSARLSDAPVNNNASQGDHERASETEEERAVVETGPGSENGSENASKAWPEKDEINTKYHPASPPNQNSHFIGEVKDWSGFRATDDDKDGGPVQSSFSHVTQASINRTFLQEPAGGSQPRETAVGQAGGKVSSGLSFSQPLPHTVEGNRYAKGSNAMGTFRQMKPANRDNTLAGKSATGNLGRLPGQARINKSEGRFHLNSKDNKSEGRFNLNSKDRAAHHNNPGSPASRNERFAPNGPQRSFEVFSSSKPPHSVDQQHVGDIAKDMAGKSTYGIFSAAKTSMSVDQTKPSDAIAAATNSRPSPKFGNFISKKASPSDVNASEK